MVFFRTRAEGKYGWGNLARLSWIAKYFNENENTQCYFIIEGGEKSKNYIKNLGFEILICKKNISINEEIELLKNFNLKINIIVEMLDFNYEHQLNYRNQNFNVVILDDLLEQRYCSSVVICGQEHTDQKPEIIKEKYTKFYYGYDYFPMNPLLKISYKSFDKEINHKKNLGVFLGGVPYSIALLKIAKSLIDFESFLDINFVIGHGECSFLKEQIIKFLPKANIYETVNVKEYLSNLDYAIVGGGYSKIEAYLYKIPSIIVSTQYHQIPLAETFSIKTNQKHLGHVYYLNNKSISAHISELVINNSKNINYNLLKKLDKSFEKTVNTIKKELRL